MNGNNYKSESHVVTSSPETILTANANRKALILFNTGEEVASFTIGAGYIAIAAGDHVAFLDRPPINAVRAMSEEGSTIVSWEA